MKKSRYSMAIFHYIAGALAVFSILVNPVLTIGAVTLFLIYELNEDWYIKDQAWIDIREFMVSFYIGLAILLLIKFL